MSKFRSLLSLRPQWRWPVRRWQRWWQGLTPVHQDRLVSVVPLISVLLFLAAIASAFTYFTQLEAQREQQEVTRDVEYAQQRLRLRLLEPHEPLQRMAQQIVNQELDPFQFSATAELLAGRFPELLAVSWLDAQNRVVATHAAALAPAQLNRSPGQPVLDEETGGALGVAREIMQPHFSRPLGGLGPDARLLLLLPLTQQGRYQGTLLVEYSLELLLRLGVPGDVRTRYAVALIDLSGNVVAGSVHQFEPDGIALLPWTGQPRSHQMAVAPVGPHLQLRATGYRISRDAAGEGFFWVVGSLSLLTIWMLLTNLRITRRRLQAQRALQTETLFRRAMENSMLTGMRALDLNGRITYVNPAFCSMTGWSESDLVGAQAPFPYWPAADVDKLHIRLEDELSGRTNAGGFEMPVQRKNGSTFFARMYVSPLIDSKGQQTGWMTSMTDISEPKRVREELGASYRRFTTVLDTLDQAVSVAPLNSTELLFANRMYQTWFGSTAGGHRQLIQLSQSSGTPASRPDGEDPQSDGLAGLPTDSLFEAHANHAELFIETLNQWLEVRSRYLTWVDGRLVQMVIASDITARRRAEQQAALQQERAEAASRLITMGEMASSVAHELNQPLTAISNYSSGMIARLQQQQISEAELLEVLQKTAKQAQRAGQIIQRIRAFVKRSEPTPTPSDAAQMVGNAVELAEIDLRRHLVRLNTYVAARLPQLLVDPILIEQVLINLLKNAGEAIIQAQRPVGQRQVELCVTPRHIEGLPVVEFSVRDNGRGIPPEQLERIYEAFYSTKAEGMGIGLKLCRSIVESHHGRLQARNLYNGQEIMGCEFSFWIPTLTALNP
ncbi:PAS domain-containing sensor histidine kinase [Serpentinimonas barnesii]|uniref:PAS domain-containing sensor histidine kinase n=1 Tax=Serpentinimonas barnesii TaxID=1458427 RepID=UPI0005EDB59F|nr:PAS domain-containing sensor histidine kinase [Serpentinimonas barnesii]